MKCKRCDDVLGDGSPAESYAGTYTGLCNQCMREGPVVLRRYRDGAQQIEYAPSCPSWRRDREDFWAYNDCPECEGKGFVWKRRASGGGRYRHFCQSCLERFYSHPLHKWYSTRMTTLVKAGNATFNQELEKAGLLDSPQTEETRESIERIRKATLARYHRLRQRMQETWRPRLIEWENPRVT